jgi:tetratricopeptide (TPR) repeat protein
VTSSILLCLALAAAEIRPTVAVVPPVPAEGAESWIGLAIADNLTTRLLIHSRFDPKTLARIYPLNVFGWRQALAAARADGINASRPMSPRAIKRLQRQLGSEYTFVGSYTTDGKALRLSWRLFGDPARRNRTLTTDLTDLATGTEELAREVLEALGQSTKGLSGHRLRTLPLDAMKPYGEALVILGGQSLDPRAHLILRREEIERAHGLLALATEAAPAFVRAWVERGIASAMVGDMPRAEEELVTAMGQAGEFEPANALGLYYLYDRQGKQQDAIKVLAEATSTHAGFLHGLGYLGQAYSRAGQVNEALQTFTAYQARVPKNPWARSKRAEVLSRSGLHAQALEEAQALAAEMPSSVMALTALASRQIDAKKFGEARATVNRALVLRPHHPTLLTRLSYIALEQNEVDEALTLARRAVEALGDGRGETLAGYAHLNLAHALALTGKKREALEMLQRAKELGVDAHQLVMLRRDARLRDLMNDPRNPFR